MLVMAQCTAIEATAGIVHGRFSRNLLDCVQAETVGHQWDAPWLSPSQLHSQAGLVALKALEAQILATLHTLPDA